MLKQLRLCATSLFLTASICSSYSALNAQDGAADSTVTEEERALLVLYKGDVVIPDALLRAYAAFVADTKVATEDKLTTHCLPNSVQITSGVRPPQRRWYGRDMNIPFLRSDEFHPQIAAVRVEGDDCYQLRTGSSAVYFVHTHSGKWRIYSYSDKPIK